MERKYTVKPIHTKPKVSTSLTIRRKNGTDFIYENRGKKTGFTVRKREWYKNQDAQKIETMVLGNTIQKRRKREQAQRPNSINPSRAANKD